MSRETPKNILRGFNQVYLQTVQETQGQSTLEYALVTAALLSVFVCLGCLWHYGASGELQRLAEQAASHLVETLSGLRDICLF